MRLLLCPDKRTPRNRNITLISNTGKTGLESVFEHCLEFPFYGLSVSKALTWLSSGQDVLWDADSVRRIPGPVHHSFPALHGEVEVNLIHNRTLMDA